MGIDEDDPLSKLTLRDDWTQPMLLFQALHDYFGGDDQFGLVRVCK